MKRDRENSNFTKVQLEAQGRGLSFIGWAESYKGCYTKLILSCPVHGNWSTTNLQSFLSQNIGCRKCKIRKNDEELKGNILKNENYINILKLWRDEESISKEQWMYTCKICSDDDFVKEGLCSGIFLDSHSHMMKGRLRCRCSKSPRWTKEQNEFRIKKVLAEENKGYSFQGWSGDYSNVKSKFILGCQTHGVGILEFNACLSAGQRCSKCAGKNHKYCYIAEVSKNGIILGYKFGITNSPERRVYEQNINNKTVSRLIMSFRFEKSEICGDCERECKRLITTGVVSKLDMPEGFSETVSVEDLDNLITIFEKFGGKKV